MLDTPAPGLARLEVLEGPTGRRKWPDSLKGRVVTETLEKGARVSEVARRHGLSPQAVTTWRRLARQGKLVLPAGEAADFAPIVVNDVAPAAGPGSREPMTDQNGPRRVLIEIEADGVIVRLPEDAAPARIADIVRILRRAR